jgi:hypothetical protein
MQAPEQSRKQYAAMQVEIHNLEKDLGPNFPKDVVQPVKNPLELIILVRMAIPKFQQFMNDAVAGQDVALKFRKTSKSLGRIVQKSTVDEISQGADPGPHVDCSKVKDVYGCLVECNDFDAMGAIIGKMKGLSQSQTNKDTPTLCRSKNRWPDSSCTSGGWRDFLASILVDGVIFEAQFVHTRLLTVREVLDGHKAYEGYRLQIEALQLTKASMKEVVTKPQRQKSRFSLKPKKQTSQLATKPQRRGSVRGTLLSAQISAATTYDVVFSVSPNQLDLAEKMRKLLPRAIRCFSVADIDPDRLGFSKAQWLRANQRATVTVCIVSKEYVFCFLNFVTNRLCVLISFHLQAPSLSLYFMSFRAFFLDKYLRIRLLPLV